eukprot:CAMPEP_0184715536 /NCGR_PEP_ID=MMETSP0314-20130426/5448_1 /TAXON_ID=38298 /ORGANISM="Rhodella maculata, Strain CCMP 736" /LENGTH=118 /DNA_ID=CAMNT_0027178717 /DNA_START=178 /DNA_END=531 /DNA_ORIENTATION=-
MNPNTVKPSDLKRARGMSVDGDGACKMLSDAVSSSNLGAGGNPPVSNRARFSSPEDADELTALPAAVLDRIFGSSGWSSRRHRFHSAERTALSQTFRRLNLFYRDHFVTAVFPIGSHW